MSSPSLVSRSHNSHRSLYDNFGSSHYPNKNPDVYDYKTDDRKRRRIIGRLISGFKRYWGRSNHPMFLTLTSMDIEAGNRLGMDWSHYVKWLRREYGYLAFCKLTTWEGNGVIHAVVSCTRLLNHFRLNKYGCIEFLRANWVFFHGGSFKIDMQECYGSLHGVIGYLTPYIAVSHHRDAHLGYSRNWIFPGWVKVFHGFIKKYGFQPGIALWDRLLENYDGLNLQQFIFWLSGRSDPFQTALNCFPAAV